MKTEIGNAIGNCISASLAGLVMVCTAWIMTATAGFATPCEAAIANPHPAGHLGSFQEAQQKQESQGSGQEIQTGDQEKSAAEKKAADDSSKTGDEKGKIDWPQTEDGWFIVTPEGGEASFQVPAVPEASSRTMVSGGDKQVSINLNVAVDSKGANLVFTWHDQQEAKTLPEITKILDGSVRGALAMTLGEVESAERINVGLLHACNFKIRFVFKDKPMKLSSRTILHQKRVYQLTYVAPEESFSEPDQQRFLDSFQHLPPPPIPDPKKQDSDK